VSGVGCERKHDVRDDMCLGVQNSKAASFEAELCNEEGMMREGRDTDGVGDEAGDDVVCSHREGTIPISSNRARVHPCRSGRGRCSPGGGVSSA
jgi:hypothetical protein